MRFIISSDEERRLLTKFKAVGNKKIKDEIKKGLDLFNNNHNIAETSELKFFAQSFKDNIQFEDSEIEKEATEEEAKILLGELFESIVKVLKKYIKLKEEYYQLVAVWVLGTYMMDDFSTFPYLFINAQKGSGKTRLLKLLETLVKDGELMISMREAVLFRIASKGSTILIDELENIDKKENYALKELLNACYKRGMKVYRNIKVDGKWELEAFHPFAPIVIANISGTDDVLGDRCITIRLDKSSNKDYSSRQEDFNESLLIQDLKNRIDKFRCSSVVRCSSIWSVKNWNIYRDLVSNNTTYNTYNTYNTQETKENTLPDGVVSVFNRIDESGLTGRALELVFPLLVVSLMLNDDIFNNVLKFSKEIMDKKKDDDLTESDDVSLIEFVSKMSSEMDYGRYRYVHELCGKFRYFMGIRNDREQEEINPRWLGRALKRMGLIRDKRRLSAGVEVTLNIAKATKLLESLK